MKTAALLLLSLLLFAGLAGCGSKKTASGPPIFTQAQAEIISDKEDISYKEAVAIIGSPGKEISRKNGRVEYEWKNPDGTFVDLAYQDDKMISKDISMIKKSWQNPF